MTIFKREIINQSVLTWLKILVIAFLRNIRNVVSILAILQACKILLCFPCWEELLKEIKQQSVTVMIVGELSCCVK